MIQATDANTTIGPHIGRQLLHEVSALVAELHPQQPPSVSLDSSIDRELGIDSLGRVELVTRLEQRFNVGLPAQAFAEADTPRDLLHAVLAAMNHGAALPPGAIPRAEPAIPAPGGVPEQALTVSEVLRWHAAAQPDRPHIRLLIGDDHEQVLTYGQLLAQAQTTAAGLQARGVQPGDTIALMLPTGNDYFLGFLAILLCGAIPVPIYPPVRLSQLEDHVRRHAGILNNCQASMMITVAQARGVARLLQTQVESLRAIVAVAELQQSDSTYTAPASGTEDIAFLQYTSGSTGNPKGVILTHANLLSNIRAMGQWVHAKSSDVFVSWLPLYHDMGLIGAWLGSLYYGMPLVIMSPLEFLARPQRWLWAIHRYRGTLSAAPNFAYELCLKRIRDADIEGLDLSSWRGAFNGAEPVSPATVERFTQRFAPFGFRPETLMPVYGLAEAAVGLAFPPSGRAPVIDRIDRETFTASGQARPAAAEDSNALRFVACGQPLPDYQVRVVDQAGAPLPDRREGRLEFRGPSATRGYYRNPAATEGLLRGDWLDSGDLAYTVDGEIYVTGRIKDLIIRAGRNIYAQELEEAVGDIRGIRKGCVAVFGSTDTASGTERLVVVAEVRKQDPATLRELHGAVLAKTTALTGGPPDDVVLAAPHTVLKTSSGKIRRSATRALYERGGIGRRPHRPWWGLLRMAITSLPVQLRRLTRRAAAQAYAGYAWVVFSLLATVTWLGVALLPPPRWRWALMRAMAHTLALATGTPLRIQGLDHLADQKGACIIVSNHMSYLDGLILVAALPRPLGFIAKEAFAKQFFVGTFLRRSGAHFVERFDPRRGLDDMAQITQAAQTGRTLLFFAEGTFSAIPGLRPFRMGAFVTAIEAQLPIVPVAISGTRSMLRSGSWHPRPGAVEVTIGAALQPAAPAPAPTDNWRAALRLRDAVRAEILAHCGEPDLSVRQTGGITPPDSGA